MEMKLATEDLRYALKFIVAGYFFDMITNFDTNKGTSDKKNNGSFKISDKDKDVLRLFADGLLPEEIAKKLYMSKNAVTNKIDEIFAKLENQERTKAAKFIIKDKTFVL